MLIFSDHCDSITAITFFVEWRRCGIFSLIFVNCMPSQGSVSIPKCTRNRTKITLIASLKDHTKGLWFSLKISLIFYAVSSTFNPETFSTSYVVFEGLVRRENIT